LVRWQEGMGWVVTPQCTALHMQGPFACMQLQHMGCSTKRQVARAA
jgi:hypothetical protein